eukprot:253328-Amphidinium_carterae.1
MEVQVPRSYLQRLGSNTWATWGAIVLGNIDSKYERNVHTAAMETKTSDEARCGIARLTIQLPGWSA